MSTQPKFGWGAHGMAANGVNLDALIPRADLSIGEGVVSGTPGDEKMSIPHFLNRAFFLNALRKPEFQRETVQWTPAKIADLVSAFLDRRLIPAIILWRAGEHNFVVDGAHRLSALLAWIHDDYGDGERSKTLFGPIIPPEQLAIADKTRRLVHKKIGRFAVFDAGVDHPDIVTDEQRRRISNLSVAHFVAQWVPAATAKAAEDSFFTINEAATPLDQTEKRIIRSRDSANAIASRAIAHGGAGYPYWNNFPDPAVRKEVVDDSGKIFGLLYRPPLSDGPIDTLDVPIAGRGYSVLPFVFDLVNRVNGAKVADSTAASARDKLAPDVDGRITASYLAKVLRTVSRMTGKDPTSLGLHPVVYFYSRGGAFSPWAFLSWASIIDELFETKRANKFCEVRQSMERFLVEHKWAMTEIIHKNGSGHRSTPWLERYWRFVLDLLLSGKEYDEVLDLVSKENDFKFLLTKSPVFQLPGEGSKGRISAATRTAAIWDAALPGAPRCTECGGYWHRNSIHGDHIVPRRAGGSARQENVGITHPYCDSAYKDYKAKQTA